jgi:hypothetical protein
MKNTTMDYNYYTIHMNGTIRIQSGTKSKRINTRRAAPFSEELLNTHISELDTKLYPSIPKWSLT